MSDAAVESTPAEPDHTPVITVTRGNPTPEETAVLTVLLSALSGPGEDTDAGARRGWSRPARRLSGGLSGMGWGRF